MRVPKPISNIVQTEQRDGDQKMQYTSSDATVSISMCEGLGPELWFFNLLGRSSVMPT
jgi:hypothetical protein